MSTCELPPGNGSGRGSQAFLLLFLRLFPLSGSVIVCAAPLDCCDVLPGDADAASVSV